MYHRYFSFKERPFCLVPDPAYLFLAPSHQEALAHLTYAAGAGDGFVAVTGEVGTGKTTLCRAFLDGLDRNVASAYIFNPPADPVDLIRAVNRDLGLSTGPDDLQEMIQALNAFLIREKSRGRQVVLVIDEAQTLNRHVLEQIRLLSNLETARSKLLQIILVGQPELDEILKSKDLRQLRQRITLRCRLHPLSLAETGAYIRHRLAVASQSVPVVFSPAAVRRIYRFSAGIPRLVNIACDRALLVAFTRDRMAVDGRIAGHAVCELRGIRPGRRRARKTVTAALAVALLSAAAALSLNAIGKGGPGDETPAKEALSEHLNQALSRPVSPDAAPSREKSAGAKPERADPAPDRKPGRALPAFTRAGAVETVLSRWGGAPGSPADSTAHDSDPAFMKTAARQAGFSLYCVENHPELTERLDLPAILAMNAPAGEKASYLVLTGINDAGFLLASPRTRGDRLVEKSEVNRRWSGTAYILWRDFFKMTGEIPAAATPHAIVTLKRLLRQSGYAHLSLGAVYDAATRQAVADFQARHGLPVDGVVGSLTKIALYNTRADLRIPHLVPVRVGGTHRGPS